MIKSQIFEVTCKIHIEYNEHKRLFNCKLAASKISKGNRHKLDTRRQYIQNRSTHDSQPKYPTNER